MKNNTFTLTRNGTILAGLIVAGLLTVASSVNALESVYDEDYSISLAGVISCASSCSVNKGDYELAVSSLPRFSTSTGWTNFLSGAFSIDGRNLASDFPGSTSTKTVYFHTASFDGTGFAFTYYQGNWYRWDLVRALLEIGGDYDPSYITISNATTTNLGIYIYDVEWYLDNNGILPPYVLQVNKNGVLYSTTSVSYGVIGSSTGRTLFLDNGSNLLSFLFCGSVGCQSYYSKMINYSGTIATSTLGGIDVSDLYDEIKQGLLTQWNSIDTTCNLFSAFSTSTFSLSQCLIDLAIPSTTTLAQNIETGKKVFPFNLAWGMYDIFANNVNTKELKIEGTLPTPLGTRTFSYEITSSTLAYLWNATSTGKFGASSTETLSTRVSRYLDPVFYFLFGIYCLGFFFRAFRDVSGQVTRVSRGQNMADQRNQHKYHGK